MNENKIGDTALPAVEPGQVPGQTDEADAMSLSGQLRHAASHPQTLPRVLRHLAESLAADQAFLVIRDGQRKRLLVNVMFGVHRDLPARFDLDMAFGDNGPWAGDCSVRPDGAVWRALLGSRGGEGAFAAVGDCGILGVFRSQQPASFTAAEQQELQALAAVAAGSLDRFKSAAERELSQETASILLDIVASPLLVVEAGGFVIFANAAARQLVAARDGIIIENGFLQSPALRANGRLMALVASAARSVLTPAPAGGALSLPRGNERRPLGVLVQPLARRSGVLSGEKPLVAVQVSAPENAQAPQVEVLRGLFSLTPAEASLLQALMQDRRIEDYASERGVSVTTVRTQLAHLFRKTSTNRQSELVRLALVAAGCLKLH